MASWGTILGRTVFAITGLAVALMGLALPIGCAKPKSAEPSRVVGRVMFQGQGLADGVVVFVPDAERGTAGPMLSALVNASGRFVLADGAEAVAPGWYRVAIAEPAGWSGGQTFPPELRRPDRSGLEREVKPGHDHDFDFQIELTR